jgi:hypothetical protein
MLHRVQFEDLHSPDNGLVDTISDLYVSSRGIADLAEVGRTEGKNAELLG